ncbi:AB hydrolase superfamily protein C4A8.06c [Leucoagaricus sp. SymC.cos]|nr:AB hydrolase superfamily protein C4A8.06c [Leucoagaricus sp. SymC.cos]
MLSNSLTRDMGLKVGPVMLGTFVKHYFDRVKSRDSADPGRLLKQDEILYDEAFHIIKSFLHESTFHTVEELQGFSNTQTPSSPYTHLVRVLIPLSCCDDAAKILVNVLGGEHKAREIVGGVKWWQVRGIEGVDAQWITAKKDWREAKRRRKMCEAQSSHNATASPGLEPQSEPSNDDGTYEKHMDEMRCILYLHGGGYYFGSVDQERYSIQRHARKINGRVFAINYRLAPQYPFPCGLHDALSAYLYLVQPPPEADHRAIKPEHIVIAGDSAGGGGVLISPWCDLTHSFPSIHTNTATDILPPTGLSFHKPSIVWPPPPHDVSVRVHASLRQKLRHAFGVDECSNPVKAPETPIRTSSDSHSVLTTDMPVNVGEGVQVPSANAVDPQRLALTTGAGEQLEIDRQVHFYTQNSLLVHPLVSPAHGYLGGLPPLLFIASDKEVLRDEIIYTAHRAASPHKFPVKGQPKSLYPLLEGIQERHPQPTAVHLQVYDGTCHVMPVLFLFSTPAKFCYRAMASFIRFVTGMPPGPSVSASDSSILKMGRHASSPEIKRSASSDPIDSPETPPLAEQQSSSISAPTSENSSGSNTPTGPSVSRKQSLRRALSYKVAMAGRAVRRQSREPIQEGILESSITTSSDVTGSVFRRKTVGPVSVSQDRYAGEPSVYGDNKDPASFGIIRERISTQGVVRPLEPEPELDAFTVPEEMIGMVSELTIRRYSAGEVQFRRKFKNTYKHIEKTRIKNLKRVAKEEGERLDAFRASASNSSDLNSKSNSGGGSHFKFRESVMNSPGWGYAWALDEMERPPPSSIVARRDTEEARKLALIADRAVLEEASELNANSLWSVMMNFLAPPDRMNGSGRKKAKVDDLDAEVYGDGEKTPTQETVSAEEKPKSRSELRGLRTFSHIFTRYKSSSSS